MLKWIVGAIAVLVFAGQDAFATNRYYSDFKVVSENGRYEFAAVSPDNADPKRPKPFASHFVYTLKDLKTGRVLWQRKQTAEYSSPQSAWVRDDGWCVVRAGSLEFIDPQGTLLGRVGLLGQPEVSKEEYEKYVRETTAGPMWGAFSLWYFVQAGERDCFVIRTWWGRRMICSVRQGAKLAEDAEIRAACEAYERAYVLRELRKGIGNRKKWEGDECCCPEAAPVQTAAFLAGKLKVVEAVPLLLQLQNSPYSGSSSSGNCAYQPLKNGIKADENRTFDLRQIVHLSLRRLSVLPDASACTELGDYNTPYRIPPLARPRAENVGNLGKKMRPEQVLALVGAPDFIDQGVWYYDMDTSKPYTLLITWGRDGVDSIRRETPPLWSGEKWDFLLTR